MCKYSKLMDSENIGDYSISEANLFGLYPAVYMRVLISIANKADRKNKLDSDGFFTVERKYITDRTTLTPANQREIDDMFSKIGVITVSPNSKDKLKIDFVQYIKLSLETDVTKISEMQSTFNYKEVKKKTKHEAMADMFKSYIDSSNLDSEIVGALYNWIECVCSKKAFNRQTVLQAQKVIFEYGLNKNVPVCVDIINESAAKEYNDLTYCYQNYLRNHGLTHIVPTIQTVKSQNVMFTSEISGEEF